MSQQNLLLTRVGHDKLPSEPHLGLEIYHQPPLSIDPHAGWIQGTCVNSQIINSQLQD